MDDQVAMRNWIRLALLGLCVAMIASWLARALQPEQGSGRRAMPLDVVVAARDIDVGRVLTADDLATERVADSPKARAGVPIAAAAVGRTAASSIRKGQLVREDDLATPGAGAALASQVPEGQRAVTVALRDPGPGPALYPGAFVDVLVTADLPGKAGGFRESMTKTLIERARVLAVNDRGIGIKADAPADARDRRNAPRQPTLTLLVTPEQAAQLELASVRGTVGIALRAGAEPSPQDGVGSHPSVTTSGMLGITIEPEPSTTPPAPVAVVPEAPKPSPAPEPEPAAPPKPVVWEVSVVRGDAVVKHPFPVRDPAPGDSSKPTADPKR